MSLPISGPISFNDLKIEFGDTYPIGLNEFYAGGGKVPVGASGALGPIPTSGPIALDNFYGSAGSLVSGAGWRTVSIGAQYVAQNGSTLVSLSYSRHSSDAGISWQTDIRTGNIPYSAGGPGFYLNGKYHALTNVSGYYKIATSVDGLAWVTDTSYSMASNLLLLDLQYSTGRLYGSTVLAVHTGRATTFSTDYGVTWTLPRNSLSMCQFIQGAPEGIAAGCDGLFMQINYGSPSGIETSPDLVTWTRKTVYDTLGNAVTLSSDGQAFIYKNKFYMVMSNLFIISSDGASFTAHTPALPNWNGTSRPLITPGDTYMLAVYTSTANTTVAASSTDGMSWNAVASPGLTYPTQLLQAGSNWVLLNGSSVKYAPV